MRTMGRFLFVPGITNWRDGRRKMAVAQVVFGAVYGAYVGYRIATK